MKVLWLELENYRCFEKVRIDFPEGLYRIDGPNGIGKSSLVEALRFLLWGKGRSPTLQRYIRRGASSASVRGCILLSGQRVEAERSVTSKGGKFSVEVNGQPLGGNSREAQRLLEEKIGMDHDTFVATSFFIQRGDDMFTAATPAKRKEYLRKVLGMEVFDRARKIAAERLRDEKVRLAEVEKTIAGAPGLVEEQAAREALQAAQEKRNEASVEVSRLEGLEKKYNAQAAAVEKAEAVWAAAVAKQDAVHQAALTEYQAKVAGRNEVVQKLASANQTLTSLATSIREGRSGVEKKTQQVQEFAESISNIRFHRIAQSQIDDAKAAADAAVEVYTAAKVEVSRLQKKLADLQGAHDNPLCPTCDSSLPEPKRVALYEQALKALEEAEERHREVGEAHDKAHATHQELREKWIHNEQATVNKQGYEKQKARAMGELEEMRASVGRWGAEDAKAKKEKASLEAQLAKMPEVGRPVKPEPPERPVVRQVSFNVDELAEARMAWEAAVAADKSAEAQLAAVLDAIKKVGEQKKRHSEIEAAVDRLRKLEHAFGKDGVTALMMRGAVRDIEQVANDILVDLFPGVRVRLELDRELKSGEKTDGFEIELDTPTGPTWYEDMSGGQETLINLALRLALSWYLTKRTGASIDIVVLDEVFASLDPQNRESVARVLRALQSKFAQIVMISHTLLAAFIESGIQVYQDGDVSKVRAA